MEDLKSLGRYQIQGVLGKGAMGLVYDAIDPNLGRRVAIKTILTRKLDAEAARMIGVRFEREVRAVARLNHPNIVQVYDFGAEGDLAYIVMEFIQGRELKDYFDANERFELKKAFRLMIELLDALEFAHEAGIVHRDIKPGNVMVGDDGHVKVLDFGLARQFRMPGSDEMGLEGSTIPGRPLGTANYMAPERILQLPLDPRSDLFSLGVIMYEMATGRLPFAGASPGETVTNVLDRDPVPLEDLAPHRPASLGEIVDRLLRKRAADRYQSAEALMEALSRIRVPPQTMATRLWRRLLPGR
jgi:serine/threonine-protein kinase